MKKKILVLVIGLAASNILLAATAAQQKSALNIPKTKPGQCQALVIKPAEFTSASKNIEVKEAATTKIVIPAKYETVEKVIVIKPAHEETKVIPATYKTVEKKIEISEPEETQEVIAPTWSTIIQEEEVKPKYLDAKKSSSGRFNKSDEALRLVEVPAERKSFKKKVVQEEASVKVEKTKAKMMTVKMQVLDQPERLEKITVPAETRTIKVKKLVTPAQYQDKKIPAETKAITVYNKVRDAEISWQSVPCTENLSEEKIELLQTKLNSLGYETGEPDGKLGPNTFKAIEQYEKDKDLDIGGITFELLKSLNISTQ